MKDQNAQKRECGVAFEPVLDGSDGPYIAVDYDRPYQLLTLEEARELDANLHAAYRRAWLASRRRAGEVRA